MHRTRQGNVDVRNPLPWGFAVPQNGLWDNDSQILKTKQGYWQRIKRFADMTERERQSYLDKHARRMASHD